MTTTTKEAIKGAVHDLAVAKKAEEDATAARITAEAAFRAAQALEQTRRAEYDQAEQALTDARAAGWVEDHPDDLVTVRAGADFQALARLKLGRMTDHLYWYNDLGRAVRRILGK